MANANNNNQCLMFVAFMIVLNVIFMSPHSIFKLYFYCNGLPFKNPTIYHHNDNNYSINNLSSLYGIKLKNQKILNDIKEAFKMFPNNGHLKKMIPKMFNIYNPNPIYVFLLPFSNNKSAIIDVDDNSDSINSTIILERNDFSTPIYPNITATDIILDWLLSSLYRRNKNLNKNKNNDENFEHDKYPNINIQHQIYRYIEENTILENIQTEKNFIDYVKGLNAKEMMILSSTDNPLQYPSTTTSRSETIEQNEWEILGLKGWEGSLIDPKKFNEDISFSAPTESNRWTRQNKNDLFNLNKLFATIQMNSSNENYENLNNKTEWDLPGKMSLSNKDDDDENAKSKFMLKLNDTLLKMFNFDSNNDNNDGGKLKKMKWPITSSRKNHRDSDIFIGRANDPFGHSTKWQTKNQTKQSNNNNDNNDNNNSNDDDRHKRAIVELYSMIKCSTGCDPLIFKGYGCYCGFSGAGRPMDGIDRCCRLHDSCYEKSVCPSFLEYFVPYLWKCYRGKPLCAIEHGEWGNGINSCASRLCQCDLKLAKCLQKFQCPKKRIICRTSKIRMLQNFLTIF